MKYASATESRRSSSVSLQVLNISLMTKGSKHIPMVFEKLYKPLSHIQSNLVRWFALFEGDDVRLSKLYQENNVLLFNTWIVEGGGERFHVEYRLDLRNSKVEVGEFPVETSLWHANECRQSCHWSYEWRWSMGFYSDGLPADFMKSAYCVCCTMLFRPQTSVDPPAYLRTKWEAACCSEIIWPPSGEYQPQASTYREIWKGCRFGNLIRTQNIILSTFLPPLWYMYLSIIIPVPKLSSIVLVIECELTEHASSSSKSSIRQLSIWRLIIHRRLFRII